MPHQVDITISIEDDRWDGAVPDVESLCERAARAALIAADAQDPDWLPGGPVEMSLVLADDATVQELNRDYRAKDKPTNVLSFALYADGESDGDEGEEDGADEEFDVEEIAIHDDDDDNVEFLSPEPAVPVLLGDVILAFETVEREASEQGKPFTDHLTHLVTHGVLHLLGYDHIEDSEAEQMERLETQILSGLGIADPYAGRPEGHRAPDDHGGSAADDPGDEAPNPSP